MRRLLEGTVATRRKLARWILLLEELGRLAMTSGRTWVEREQWVHLGNRDERWDEDKLAREGWDNSSPKQDVLRCQAWLLEHGVLLELESLQLRDGGWQHRIHVGTVAIAELLEADLRDARIVDELATAKREGRAPDMSWLDVDPPPAAIAEDYGPRKFHLGRLERKYGFGRRRLKKTLEAQKVEIREKRRMRISERIPPERVRKALEAHDEGASSRAIADQLGVTHTSALRFLRSHGRDTRPREQRGPPPDEAPPGPATLIACEQSATCASAQTSRRARVWDSRLSARRSRARPCA